MILDSLVDFNFTDIERAINEFVDNLTCSIDQVVEFIHKDVILVLSKRISNDRIELIIFNFETLFSFTFSQNDQSISFMVIERLINFRLEMIDKSEIFYFVL